MITAIIAGVAKTVGAELVGKALGGDLGKGLAGAVVDTIAGKLGVETKDLPKVPEAQLQVAVKETEPMMPELIALWAKGIDHQFALLQAEQKEGFWQSAWRWGWMYLLALFWICYLLVFPMLAVLAGWQIERVDVAVLLTLTTWFISLYMGGHTVKALGESAIAAVSSYRKST